jgi:uncharacterized protein (TIGR02302 family)
MRPAPKLFRLIERKLALARAALLWERLWPGMAPALGVIAAFLAVSLFDLWRHLPAWAHATGLGLFALALAGGAWLGLNGLRLPDRDQARRRLEIANALRHRPLAALEDHLPRGPLNAGPDTLALWREHRRRIRAALAELRVGAPEAGLGRHDPNAVRAIAALVLVVAVALAGGDAPRRLLFAFTPHLERGGAGSASFDAWLTPPAYTDKAPIFLTRDGQPIAVGEAALAVPTASTLLVRWHGGRGAPELVVENAGDDRRVAFAPAGPNDHHLSTAIDAGRRLALRQGGRTLASWPIDVIPDRVPDIQFRAAPKATARAALEVTYAAKDDYGIARVGVEFARAAAPGETAAVELTTPGTRKREMAETIYRDLTEHPWAGLAVRLWLVAHDAIGQAGKSAAVDFVLPERKFTRPIAKALVEQRRNLSLDPGAIPKVAKALGALSHAPSAYDNDTVIQLGLSSARARLLNNPTPEGVAAVQNLLWELALRAEMGNTAQAERDLRAAQQALQDALANNAPDHEIERLMNELRAALNQFLQAMAEQALEQARRGEDQSEPADDEQMLDMEELSKMLDQAEKLAKSGARDAARQMLAEMQKLLESLKEGRVASRQDGEAGNQALQKLGELSRRQQQLLDRSFRRSQGQPPGQQGQRGSKRGGESGDADDAGEQEALRRQLGDLLQKLGEGRGNIPNALGRADQAMRQARDALKGGLPGQAAGAQAYALDQLREGAKSIWEEMADRSGEGGPQRDGRTGRFEHPRQDPLGRPYRGEWDRGESTKVPDETDLRRARSILEELNRRSGQRQRPALEREYIDRLLRRF